MKIWIFLIVFVFGIFSINFSSAAHFIVGQVNDAYDGTSANDRIITLWNPEDGIQDNITDIIGENGNSGQDNTYMIDCEWRNESQGGIGGLQAPCQIGDVLSIRVFNSGDGYVTREVNVTVTSNGFDVAPSLRLNSPPIITSILIDDDTSFPLGEIDLTVAGTKPITCQGVILDYDGDSEITNASSEFYDDIISFTGDSDDNNYHYTNSSCFLNQSYGNGNQSSFSCSFDVHYYANAGNWSCDVSARDNLNANSSGSNITVVNELLAVGLPDVIDFDIVDGGSVSNETQVNVTNYGNVMINLSLSGYGGIPGDGWAMNCTLGNNISIDYEKFNLTSPNTGSLTLNQFEGLYRNLSSSTQVREFNLNYKQADGGSTAEHTNSTYWRIYVPVFVAGSCSGNLVFGASRSPAT